jgi:uncharacterized protein YqgC (DUF456 family)
MAYLLLALAQVAGLLMIPFGLPGTWVQVAALAAYAYFTGFATVGWVPVVVVALLALAAEAIEFLLGGSFARRYGGGRRAAWGAIVGGMVGAVVGIPLPIIGSIVGSLVGSFVGAALFELTTERGVGPALRTGWGALLGRLVATAVKSGVGVAVAAVALLTAIR